MVSLFFSLDKGVGELGLFNFLEETKHIPDLSVLWSATICTTSYAILYDLIRVTIFSRSVMRCMRSVV